MSDVSPDIEQLVALFDTRLSETLAKFEAEMLQKVKNTIEYERIFTKDYVDQAVAQAVAPLVKKTDSARSDIDGLYVTVGGLNSTIKELPAFTERMEAAVQGIEKSQANCTQQVELLKQANVEREKADVARDIRVANLDHQIWGDSTRPDAPRSLAGRIDDLTSAITQLDAKRDASMNELNKRLDPIAEYHAFLKAEREKADAQAAERRALWGQRVAKIKGMVISESSKFVIGWTVRILVTMGIGAPVVTAAAALVAEILKAIGGG